MEPDLNARGLGFWVIDPFVEFGTHKMAARHKEGSNKVLGQGMFSFALEQLKKWISSEEKEISKNIEGKFK